MEDKKLVLPKSYVSRLSVADNSLILAKAQLKKQLRSLGYDSCPYSVRILRGNCCVVTFKTKGVK